MKFVDCEAVLGLIKSVPVEELLDEVLKIPAADVQEVVRGAWIWDGYVYDMPWQCSECHCFSDTESNFCPNCGADMKGEYKVEDV